MATVEKKYTKKQLEDRAEAVAAERRILNACATAKGTIRFTKPAEDGEKPFQLEPGLRSSQERDFRTPPKPSENATLL